MSDLLQDNGSRGKARIGLVSPFSNTNFEPDMAMLRPYGVALYTARAGGYDLDEVPDSDQMRQFALSSLEAVISDLKAALPDVILYGCTSATLAHGPEFDREFAQRITDMSGAPAVTAAGALQEALTQLGAKTIAFSSPYVEALNKEAIGFLAQCGFETVSQAYVGSDLGNYGQGELTPREVFDLGMRADSDAADVLVLSCTDMRSVEAVEALEAELGKPVVTSNQALMFSALKRLDMDGACPVPCGRLLK